MKLMIEAFSEGFEVCWVRGGRSVGVGWVWWRCEVGVVELGGQGRSIGG